MLVGHVHLPQDTVDHVGHRSHGHSEVHHTGRAVHPAIAAYSLATDEGFVFCNSVDEFPHRVLELWAFIIEDLQDGRGLVVLDEGVILGADGVCQLVQDAIMGVHRFYVKVNDFLCLSLRRFHIVDSVHIGLSVGQLKGSASFFLDHAKDSLGGSNCFVNHFLID